MDRYLLVTMAYGHVPGLGSGTLYLAVDTQATNGPAVLAASVSSDAMSAYVNVLNGV